MRILNISSGIAVLFATLAYWHLLHHFFLGVRHDGVQGPAVWLGLTAGAVAGVFSLVGGCLLLKRGR